MIKAQAAVLRESAGPYTIEDVVLDEPSPEQVVVRIVAAGFCHTDVLPRSEFWPVQPPLIPGHDGAGIVESVGSAVDGVAVGDHVVLSFSFCGECAYCTDGNPAYCTTWMELRRGAQLADDQRGMCPNHGLVGDTRVASAQLLRDDDSPQRPDPTPVRFPDLRARESRVRRGCAE